MVSVCPTNAIPDTSPPDTPSPDAADVATDTTSKGVLIVVVGVELTREVGVLGVG